MFQPGLCFAYRKAAGAAELQYAQIVRRNSERTWACHHLLRAEYIDAALLPVHPYDAEAMRVDSHVRVIPLLVLDARALLLLDLGACSVCTPVLVLNEVWFRTNYAVFREGMEGVFRISQSFVGVGREPDGMASFIAATAFPLSSRRAAIFTIPKTVFDVACLLEPCGAHDRLYSQYKFR
ncbi:hypothetical protein B484DRAFT_393933, partial [Ochromonadaceae sp. CCMP2298]